ncbi:MAG: glycosyltransferase family 4 protein [Fusicatenibacter sp.]|nr:glycosyltransferase family 4 protein [Fusicatenibacter sp.]
MIGHKQVPSRAGGIEVAVEALAVRMAALGHDVTLYNYRKCRERTKDACHKERKWDYKGVHIRELLVPNVKGVSAMVGSAAATFCAIFGKYDCIHYHAEGPAAMAAVPHFWGIRTVVTIHGLDWQRSKWGKIASWYLKHGEKTAAAYADEIIVLSKSAKQYFLEHYNRETVLIPNGIDKPVKRKAEQITRLWGLKKDDYILYLGRIVPEKGLESLIEAFSRVDTNKKLVIAGGPSDTEAFYRKLQKMAEKDERILFTGFVSGELLDELYSNSYLYCLPSELEGMPISLLEAMSYGNCCLCSDIPECAQVVDKFGYLFQKGNTEDLARALQRLCHLPELVESCRSHVSEYVCDRYHWDEITKETLKLYEKEK